ncbi:hypothetical protein [Bacillus thuringiensis]|uniref:hypothetical protein n=1 Tax=Bacillus thuringiensis TaxID=1428 RepID=UPI003D658DC6
MKPRNLLMLVMKKKEGIQKGVQQGKIQMIKGMHELGVLIETIAKASKLSIKEVEDILRGNS